jgi:hypothetical protein
MTEKIKRPLSVTFKSTNDNWRKEYSNIKNNTVRVYDHEQDEGDLRFELLDKFEAKKLKELEIKVYNVDTTNSFYRPVRDVTKWRFSKDLTLYIITWGEGYGS